jgi:thiamine transport system substrate-binding protein
MKRFTNPKKRLTAAVVAIAGITAISFVVKSSSLTQSHDVVLVTHDSFVMSKSLIQEFDKRTGYHLRLVSAGDAGAMTNRLILTSHAPIGDAVFGIDNTLAGTALAHHLINGALTPTDFGDVCLNYDKYWFATHHLAAPSSMSDLTKPQYKNLTVIENPESSSPGLAFLAATVDKFGAASWSNYWSALKANQVKVDDGWEAAYYTDFSGSSGKGAYPIVLSYGTSPADEVRGSAGSQTTAIQDGCFKQTEYVGVLNGAHNVKGAKALISFLLSPTFQATFPTTMYMYPMIKGVAIPTEWSKYTSLPTRTYGDTLNFDRDRAQWLAKWNQIFG